MDSEYFAHTGLSRRQFLKVGTAAVAAGGVVLGAGQPASALTINPRSAWADGRPPKGPLEAETVEFLLVHHSASRNGHTTADAPAILRSFYDFHTGTEKGWNDIAYNFLIDAGGGVWEGRAGSVAGSVAGDATGGNQGFSQLVCLIGDYNAANPTSASKSSLVSLLAWLADKHGISTAPGSEVSFVSRGSNRWASGATVTTPTINGHRSMSQTTCPGDNLFSYVSGSLMADVTATRGGSAPPPSTEATTSTLASTTSSSSTTSSTTTSTTQPTTTTLPDSTPTVAGTGAPGSSQRTTVAPPPPTSTTPPTTLPVAVAAEPVGASRSPLIWGGAGLVSLATVALAWRYRRMG